MCAVISAKSEVPVISGVQVKTSPWYFVPCSAAVRGRRAKDTLFGTGSGINLVIRGKQEVRAWEGSRAYGHA